MTIYPSLKFNNVERLSKDEFALLHSDKFYREHSDLADRLLSERNLNRGKATISPASNSGSPVIILLRQERVAMIAYEADLSVIFKGKMETILEICHSSGNTITPDGDNLSLYINENI